MCNNNGTFARSLTCSNDELCTGSTREENAVQSSMAQELLCSEGNL